jgi:hypothetical protein
MLCVPYDDPRLLPGTDVLVDGGYPATVLRRCKDHIKVHTDQIEWSVDPSKPVYVVSHRLLSPTGTRVLANFPRTTARRTIKASLHTSTTIDSMVDDAGVLYLRGASIHLVEWMAMRDGDVVFGPDSKAIGTISILWNPPPVAVVAPPEAEDWLKLYHASSTAILAREVELIRRERDLEMRIAAFERSRNRKRKRLD